MRWQPRVRDNVQTKDRGSLSPIRSPERWVVSGLTFQTVGVAGAATYAWLRLRREGIGGHITAATIRLAWHADVHTRAGVAVIAAGAIIYAVGSMLMARPYVSRPVMLFVAVPAAAVIGMLALGVLVLIVAILLAAIAANIDLPLDIGGGGGSSGTHITASQQASGPFGGGLPARPAPRRTTRWRGRIVGR